MKINGLDELIARLEAAGRQPEGIVKQALYEGAGIVADAIRSGVSGLQVNEAPGTRARPKTGVTSTEKAGLLHGFGISKMRKESDVVSVVVGFNGTNADGHKNTTIMRRVESGTSFQNKTPVVRPAVNRSKSAAQEAMRKVFTDELNELI